MFKHLFILEFETAKYIIKEIISDIEFQEKQILEILEIYQTLISHFSSDHIDLCKLKEFQKNFLLWAYGPVKSPDFNPIEMLWQDLKTAVHIQMPSNLNELKQCYKEERAKIPPQRCERLIKSLRKLLLQVVAAKGDSTSF